MGLGVYSCNGLEFSCDAMIWDSQTFGVLAARSVVFGMHAGDPILEPLHSLGVSHARFVLN